MYLRMTFISIDSFWRELIALITSSRDFFSHCAAFFKSEIFDLVCSVISSVVFPLRVRRSTTGSLVNRAFCGSRTLPKR
jgi:hypothetical protein